MTHKDIRNSAEEVCARPVHETTDRAAELQPEGSRSNQARNAAGHYAAAPEVEAERRKRVADYLAEIEGATVLPATFIDELRAELAMLLDAIRESTQELAGAGVFTSKGTLRLAFRTRLFLAERASAIAKQLGLEAPAGSSGKSKPWSKLSRAEQEAQAQAALDALHSGAGGFINGSTPEGEV